MDINFNFTLSAEDAELLSTILNSHINSFHKHIMEVMTGKDTIGTVEYYEKIMAYDEALKDKIFQGVAKQIEEAQSWIP